MGWTGARDALRNAEREKAWLRSTSCPPLTSMFSLITNLFITLMTPVTVFVKKATKGGAPIVMVSIFQQHDEMRSVWSTKNQEKRMLAAEDLELVVGGEVPLEGF